MADVIPTSTLSQMGHGVGAVATAFLSFHHWDLIDISIKIIPVINLNFEI